MKKSDATFLSVVLVIALGLYFGLAQVSVPFKWRLIIGLSALCLGFLVWLVIKLLSMRRSAKIEKGLAAQQQAGPGAAPSSATAQAEMEDQFNRYLAALKESPTGKGALGDLPWYLIIGAPGSGKTTALQESGLAFSSMGHGLRSIKGIGGTRNCDWWFADNAILLDTAGRYTTQPEDHGEWLSFLDLVRDARGRRALNGIIVVVAISDLIKGDPAQISATVRPIRERIIEVSTRLRLVMPVYVVFTKADLVGGFKDFFAGFSRAQRDQVWGCTLEPGAAKGRPAREVYAERIAPLIQTLQARRVSAIASGTRSPAQLAKLTLMPGNFSALQKWLGEFVGELFAPLPIKDQPLFRGFYFTSGIQVPRPGEKGEVQSGAVPAGAGAPQAAASDAKSKDMSIFFMPGSDAPPPASEAGDSRRGLFLKDLFARVVIPDRHLAAIPAALIRRARLLRFLAVYGSIACGLLLAIWLTGRHLADQDLIARGTAAAQALVADQAGKGGDATAAVESAREVLTAARELGGGAGRAVAEKLDPLYGARIGRAFVQPAAQAIASELDKLRRAEVKDTTTYDRIFDLFRSYQMLTGQVPPDGPLLERTLIEDGRWFAASPGQPTDEVVRAGRRHLAYIAGAGAEAKGWQARLDPQLVERVEGSLGGALWIQQSFADTVSSLQSGTPLGRDQVVSGINRELIEAEIAVPSLFTPDGWEGTYQPAIAEKAAALRQRYAGIRIDRTVDEIRARLRSLYGREYNARWMRFLSGLKPVPFKDLAEASSRLRALSGEDSPYRTVGRRFSELSRVDLRDPEVRISLPTDPKWLDDGLAALVEFQAQLDRFLQSSPAGSRAKDLARLGELCAAADKTRSAFEKAASTLDGETARTAGATCLGNILDAVHRALAAELGQEQDRAWGAEVSAPFLDQLAGRFPFDPASATDCALGPFAKLFNPKSGALWVRVDTVEKLRGLRWTGRELLPTALEYQRLVVPAQKIRDAMFAGGTEDPSQALTLTLVQREGVKDMSVAVGKQSFTLYDRPNRRYRYEWKSADGGGSKISLNLASGQWITKDFQTPGWGLLRMLRDAQSQPRAEGGIALTWVFQHAGREYRAGGVLEESSLIDLTGVDFFKTLAIPARVTP